MKKRSLLRSGIPDPISRLLRWYKRMMTLICSRVSVLVPHYPFGELASSTSTAISLANLNNPLDFFELFFTDDLYALIVDQSNLYARQFIAANPNSNLPRPFAL
ncbi:unnamed protein product, partial [Staurois parvus]